MRAFSGGARGWCIFRAAGWVGLIFLLAGNASAASPQGSPLVLTLPQMIARASARSPEIRAAENETAVARSNLAQVKSAYYPQLEMTGVVGPINDAKKPVIRDNQIYDPSPGLNFAHLGIFGRLDFTLSQPLYTFGKLSNREDAARKGVQATALEIEKTRGEIALRVKKLYYALVLARMGVRASDDAVDFFQDARRRISKLLDLGSTNVTESDLYRIDAFQADTLRSRAEAEKGEKVAYFALQRLLGLPPAQTFKPSESILKIEDRPLPDLKSFIRKALHQRPEIKQLAAGLDAQEAQVRAAKSDLYPTVFAAVKGSLAGAPGRDHLDNPYIMDEFNHAYAGVVAGLKWHWDFGIGRARVDKAEAEYNTLLSTRSNAEMSIPIQVAQFYQELVEWKKSAESYHRAAIASRKWVVSAMTDFDMGVGNAQDMLTGIEKYGHNQGQYLEAVYNYKISLAQLLHAVGASNPSASNPE
jgi:outer membrane protein